jgi:uridine phosphorylase
VAPLAPAAHLHPTADLAERALLPDDPGQALALTRVLFGETPRMFNHYRGLWGYTGVALDGAPLTVQSTGIGGPSAAVVVSELHRLGLRRAVRIGRAWAIDGTLRAGELLAPTEVIGADGATRALGCGPRLAPDAGMAAALDADHRAILASVDLPDADQGVEALAFDLESAAVLAAGQRAGIPVACLVALEGSADPEGVAERLGRSALGALAPLPIGR